MVGRLSKDDLPISKVEERVADQALLRKLNIKTGYGLTLVNPPETVIPLLVTGDASSMAVLFFAYNVADIVNKLPEIVNSLAPGSLLWIAFPKRTSKLTTDLSRDNGWETVTSVGYRTVNLIAINDDWSAFRIQPIGTFVSLGRRDPNEPRPELVVPQELAVRLSTNADAAATFQKLSYTCRKEYIQWITDAKRAETKQKRVEASVAKLAAGEKSPLR